MEALTAAGEELVDRAANAYLHVARCGWGVWVWVPVGDVTRGRFRIRVMVVV